MLNYTSKPISLVFIHTAYVVKSKIHSQALCVIFSSMFQGTDFQNKLSSNIQKFHFLITLTISHHHNQGLHLVQWQRTCFPKYLAFRCVWVFVFLNNIFVFRDLAAQTFYYWSTWDTKPPCWREPCLWFWLQQHDLWKSSSQKSVS